MIRIARLHHPVTALGPGRRLGVWTQGCPLACAGCMSRDTWAPDGGAAVRQREIVALWRALLRGDADGLTVSGGEPLAQPRALARLLTLAAAARDRLRPAADILLYTGYDGDELAAMAAHDRSVRRVLDLVDAVVTGRYRAAEPTRLIWRGSANQRLTPLTSLGRSRYAPFLDSAPDRPPMQVGADESGVWLIGVPRQGQLGELTRALRDQGVRLQDVSWRP